MTATSIAAATGTYALACAVAVPWRALCTLQGIVERWDTLAPERQRRLFHAAYRAADAGDWDGLEAALRVDAKLNGTVDALPNEPH